MKEDIEMIQLLNGGAYLVDGKQVIPAGGEAAAKLKAAAGVSPAPEEAKKNTIAYGILKAHNTSGNMEDLQIKFDKLTSHDITFVGIIQTARASEMCIRDRSAALFIKLVKNAGFGQSVRKRLLYRGCEKL